jgi:Protein of unknown function (DUF3095)
MTSTDDFYNQVPKDPEFAAMSRPDRFFPLPPDWFVGVTDIVDSTGEIARGRYKVVNVVGASVVSAMMNALEGRVFPYVFGGDGASFAVSGADVDRARTVLAQLRRWTKAEFGISLRAALIPVHQIRSAGHDVRVARHAASDGVDYAMFSGGGLAWADRQMKAGVYTVDPAADLSPPDLTGLSCRWNNVRSQNGSILSLVVLPAPGSDIEGFAEVAEQVVSLAEQLLRGGHPVPQRGPQVQYPPPGLTIEAHLSRGTRPLLWRQVQLLVNNLIAWAIFKTGFKAGDFDPVHYRAAVSSNADFRKFDDGLKMTLDCDPATKTRLVALLDGAQAQGQIRYGLHDQDEAMVTCIVPSVVQEDHVHFVDGAAGGYTQAAAQIKGTA